MSFGLLLLRVIVGALFVGHGTQKLFGWFGGHGIDGTSGFMQSLGYRKPRAAATLAGATEAGAGALLLLGWLTPFAAAAIIGLMINASVAAHLDNGLWNTNGGYELPLVLATAAATLAFVGPGAVSLDSAFGWDLAGATWGVIALVLGIVAAAAMLSTRETAPAAAQTTSEEEREEARAA